jgi:hypothetical protein
MGPNRLRTGITTRPRGNDEVRAFSEDLVEDSLSLSRALANAAGATLELVMSIKVERRGFDERRSPAGRWSSSKTLQ